MANKTSTTFRQGDLVRLKDGIEDRHLEIQTLFPKENEATLSMPGSQDPFKTVSLHLLEKVPLPKKRVNSAPRPGRAGLTTQAEPSHAPQTPAVATDTPEQQLTNVARQPQIPGDSDEIRSVHGIRTLPNEAFVPPVVLPHPSISSPELADILGRLVHLLSHLQTESAKREYSPDLLPDKSAYASNLIDAVHRTFDDMWADVGRQLRKAADEAQIQSESAHKYKSQIEQLRAENFSQRTQVSTLQDRVQQIGSMLKGSEQEVHKLERQVQLERQEQTQRRSESILSFWQAREDYYKGLHRGILAEQGTNRKRLRNFRHQSLCADMELITNLGGSLDLFEEALRFDIRPYDGSLYLWYDDDEEPVPNGVPATVFLPGWRVGDTVVRACLGSKEVAIG